MLRTKVSRIACSALFVAGGLVGVGSSLITGATSAGALTTCNPAPLMCLTPSARDRQSSDDYGGGPDWRTSRDDRGHRVQRQPRWERPGTPATRTRPTWACRAGRSSLRPVRRATPVSPTRSWSARPQPTGDGNCLPGGDTSGVPAPPIAADISTQQPVANPTPFTTQ